MDVVVGMVVVVIVMAMVMTFVAVRVTVAAEYKEAHQVGEQAGRANDEYQFRVFDLGRVDKSSESFENDRDTESDEEDGIEEGAENFGSNPLHPNQR